MKIKISRIILIALSLLAIVSTSYYFYLHRGEESTDDATISAQTILISPKVSGYVKNLYIKDNQRVFAGDVLLEIDASDYLIRRDKAKAALDATREAALASHNNMETINISAPSNLDVATAELDSAKANWEKSNKDLFRIQQLNNDARSQGQLDQVIAAEKTAKANLYQAEAKLRSAKTAPKTMAAAHAVSAQLNAQLKQAEADLAQAENDLAHTKLLAPISGKISNRGVEEGNYVQTGQQLASLVGNLLWITANFKETQLEQIKPGQAVKIEIDAFPGQNFSGTVDSIQSGTGAFFSAFPPENATGNFVKIVQRVPVKIIFNTLPDKNLALGPGMSVVPIIETRQIN